MRDPCMKFHVKSLQLNRIHLRNQVAFRRQVQIELPEHADAYPSSCMRTQVQRFSAWVQS